MVTDIETGRSSEMFCCCHCETSGNGNKMGCLSFIGEKIHTLPELQIAMCDPLAFVDFYAFYLDCKLEVGQR